MWTASGSQLYTPAQKPHKKKTWGSAQYANASQEEKLKFTKVHSAKKVMPAKHVFLPSSHTHRWLSKPGSGAWR
jgi:hypothetical protein